MSDKIYLGKDRHGDSLWLEKHRWDCDWYWAFGYIGNKNLHTHISSMIDHPDQYEPRWTDVDFQFLSTWLNQSDWWVLRDLFISAYALKKAAEVYRHGGHQTAKAAPYRVTNKQRAAWINKDLKNVLDSIWDFLSERRSEREAR
jgi:hypothetical protein